MVTIISKETNESVITSATLNVTGADSASKALELALNDLDRHGWTVSIERYDISRDEDGSYTLIMF